MAAKKTTKKTASAAKEVLEKVDKKIEAESVKEMVTHEDKGAADDVAGKSLFGDDSRQADFIPGTRKVDILAVPEYVYDQERGTRRRLTMPQEYHYCWVEGSADTMTRFRAIGYWLVNYNGSNAGFEEPGLSGTYLYECDPAGHVRLGDVYLMACPIRLFEALEAEDREEAQKQTRLHESQYHNLGYRYGVRTFSEGPDGVQEHN